MQDELYERKGIRIPMTRVIMTSDESDQTWWDEVTALGWVRMDHDEQRTVERYGRWYVPICYCSVTSTCMRRMVMRSRSHITLPSRFPVILDAAIQSSGQGFVGTDRSTFSILSRRRVLDWQDGAARMVLWGRKGADDH